MFLICNKQLIRNKQPSSRSQPKRLALRAAVLCAGVVACFGLVSRPAQAGTISLSGTFNSDDDQQDFTVTLTGAPALIETTSYAEGGFDPILSVFSSAGSLLAMNDNGSCSQVAADPMTGACLDSYLPLALPAGSYLLVLTEYDNLPNGPFLADGFTEAGNGNFTGDLFGSPGESFIDFTGSQRTNAWALEFTGGSNISEQPEPGSYLLALLGTLLISAKYKSRHRKHK